jgi:hypothetical protein
VHGQRDEGKHVGGAEVNHVGTAIDDTQARWWGLADALSLYIGIVAALQLPCNRQREWLDLT